MGGKVRTRTTSSLGVVAGQVYACPLPHGLWGAVSVVRTTPKSALLLSTAYVGPAIPRADEPALRRPLRQNRFAFKDECSAHWTEEPPPVDCVLVGSFPSTQEERRIRKEDGAWGAGWQGILDAYHEWRWANDRVSFERELEEMDRHESDAWQVQEQAPRSPTPGSGLTCEDFWSVIHLIDLRLDQESATLKAIEELAKRPIADVLEFEEIMAEKLYMLDGREYAEQAGVSNSADAFLYARCFVVASGEETYRRVLSKPDSFPRDVDFEALLYIASGAYELTCGAALEHETHFSYETGANEGGWP